MRLGIDEDLLTAVYRIKKRISVTTDQQILSELSHCLNTIIQDIENRISEVK